MTDVNFTAAAAFDRKLFWEGGELGALPRRPTEGPPKG